MKKLVFTGILSLASIGILSSCLQNDQQALEEKAANTVTKANETVTQAKETVNSGTQSIADKITSTINSAQSKVDQTKSNLQSKETDIRESAKRALNKYQNALNEKKQALNNKAILAKGYQVYLQNCAACHRMRISKEEEMKFRKMAQSGVKPPIKAPPMNEISARLKVFFPKEQDFVNFVTDYITNPSREKGKCLPMAFKMFGVMPAIGASLTDDEKKAVALWLYHNFNDKWSDFSKGMKDGHNCPVKKIKVR